MSDCLSVNVYPDLQVDRVKTTAERAQITRVLPRTGLCMMAMKLATMRMAMNAQRMVQQPVSSLSLTTVSSGEKQIRGSGGSLELPGPLSMHLHTVYVEYSECLLTLLTPWAERTCFSQVSSTTHVLLLNLMEMQIITTGGNSTAILQKN